MITGDYAELLPTCPHALNMMCAGAKTPDCDLEEAVTRESQLRQHRFVCMFFALCQPNPKQVQKDT